MNNTQSNNKQSNDNKEFNWEAFIEEASKEEIEIINLDTKICYGLVQGDGFWR